MNDPINVWIAKMYVQQDMIHLIKALVCTVSLQYSNATRHLDGKVRPVNFFQLLFIKLTCSVLTCTNTTVNNTQPTRTFVFYLTDYVVVWSSRILTFVQLDFDHACVVTISLVDTLEKSVSRPEIVLIWMYGGTSIRKSFVIDIFSAFPRIRCSRNAQK